MFRTDAGQSGVNNCGGGGETKIDFNSRASNDAPVVRAASAADEAAITNGSFFKSSYNMQGDVQRLNLEQKYNGAVSMQNVSAANFVERYPAAQNLKFSETKSASDLAYTAKKDEIYQFPDGKQWRVVDARDTGGKGLSGALFSTGFRAVVLKPVDENDKRVIVSYAGSGAQAGDWLNNVSQSGGNTPSQYRQALSLARECQKKYGDNVVLTGHSLGGGLASYTSLQTGLHATAINSSALSPNNLGGNALFHPSVKNNQRITQYYVPGEVLTKLDNIDLFDARPGNKIAIPGRFNRWLDPRATIGNHMLSNLATDVPAPRRVN